MKTIYKYSVTTLGLLPHKIKMPKEAIVRHVGMSNGDVCVWVELNTKNVYNIDGQEERTFTVIGTGREIPSNAFYIGSCHDGPYVWHVFEII